MPPDPIPLVTRNDLTHFGTGNLIESGWFHRVEEDLPGNESMDGLETGSIHRGAAVRQRSRRASGPIPHLDEQSK